MAQPVELEIQGGIATFTLNRPEHGNSLNRDLCEAFASQAATLGQAPVPPRAILLKAAGKNFCVGGDISTMAASDALPAALASLATPLHQAIKLIHGFDAPVISAVRGAAAGAGLGLAVGADIVIASKTAKFALAYGAIGLSPDGGATWTLPRLIGARRTLDLALRNKRLTAEEALQWGMVSLVVDDEALDGEALAVAKAIADGPTLAFGRMRRLISESSQVTLSDQLDRESAAIVQSGDSADAHEGVRAFIEKRAANFMGR